MRRISDITRALLLSLAFFFMIAGSDVLHASMVKENRCSFEFKHIPITEAVTELSTISGVKIILHGDTGRIVLTKSFKDTTVENILIDIFNGENIAGLFQYEDQKLSAVNIWILPKNKNDNITLSIPPVFAHNNQSISSPVVSQNQDYREIQKFMQGSGIQPEVVVYGDQEDGQKASEPVRRNYYYFPGSGRGDNSDSTIKNSKSDSSSETGEHKDGEFEEVIVPPSPDPERIWGLEPPPIPPGFITVNQ